jgi:hypothetical protein
MESLSQKYFQGWRSRFGETMVELFRRMICIGSNSTKQSIS